MVVAEDVLPKVLHRWGPVPGVEGTADLTGPWDTPGSWRTVLLQGGATAREEVLLWERPHHFQYRVDRFSGPIGRLIDHAIGSWEFSSTANGSGFLWTYRFQATGLPAVPLMKLVSATAWARYMAQCADRCVELARSTSAA